MTVRAMHSAYGPTPVLPEPDGGPSVVVDGAAAVIEHLTVADPTAVMLLGTAPESDRPALAMRMVAVGAQGMAAMGLGIDLAAIDDRVGSVLEAVTGEAEATIRGILEESRRSLGEQFDPQQRSSILARALVDFGEWRDGFLRRLDPTVEGSAATELISRLQHLVGPDGTLERTLGEALDLDGSDSSLARLRRSIEEGFAEIRRDIAGHRAAGDARAEELERGTAHGLDYEDVIEAQLRTWAAAIKGCVVERTSTSTGSLTAASKVGDFVVTLPDGRRLVVEAKRQAAISLTGSGGILAELDTAIANRRAESAICVAGRDAYPGEVGRFNVYGNRILVVDEGDGTMLAVALQWAMAATGSAEPADLDPAAVRDRIDRIRQAAEQLSGARRTVTTIKVSLDKLHEQLGGLRMDILGQVDDLDRVLAPATRSA